MPLPTAAMAPGPSNVTPAPAIGLPTPPPAPRAFADSYVWRLVFSDGWSTAAMVFGFVGSIFLCVGVPLILGIITSPVGLIFALLGGAFLGIAGVVLPRRYQKAQTTLNVLRHGAVAYGQIMDLSQNLNVSINDRHPWIILYQFEVAGRRLEGSVTTLNTPSPQLQAGQPAVVLYLPNAPEHNALYPHP